jgi:hypothetical protein
MSERWFKQSSQAVHDPKWWTIAARAEAMFVEAFAAFESGEAWSAEHGGSLAGYDLEVEAAALDIPLDRFKRIWRVMVDKGMAIIEAMIDDVRVAAGRLTAWAKRQARSPAESPPAAAAVRTRGQRREGDKGERRPDQSRTGGCPLTPGGSPAERGPRRTHPVRSRYRPRGGAGAGPGSPPRQPCGRDQPARRRHQPAGAGTSPRAPAPARGPSPSPASTRPSCRSPEAPMSTPDLPAVVTASRLPAKPSLPPALTSALRFAIRTFGGASSQLDPEWQPPAADPGMLALAETVIAAYQRYLAPVDDAEWLTARIGALMHHGFVERVEPATLRLVIADWVEGLRRFPQWAIAAAAAELLSAPGRITLSAMAQACRAEVGDTRLELGDGRDPAEATRADYDRAINFANAFNAALWNARHRDPCGRCAGSGIEPRVGTSHPPAVIKKTAA